MVEWVITFVAGMMTGAAMLALLVAFFMGPMPPSGRNNNVIISFYV